MKHTIFTILAVAAFIACNKKTVEKVEQTFSDGTPSTISTYESDGKTLLTKREYYPSDSTGAGSVVYQEAGDSVATGSRTQKVYKEWSYRDNQLNGEAHSYYPDGKPWSLHTYVDGKKTGPYKTWHKNGQLFIDGAYKNDKESGIWKIYGEDGKVVSERDMDKEPIPAPENQ